MCWGNFLKNGLDFLVSVPANGFFLEDQIGAPEGAGEIFYALVVFGAVGVGVKVTRALVGDILEKLYQPKCRLQIARAKPQILVESSGRLIVEVDVERLAGFPSFRYALPEIQSSHLFMI